ncbi:formate/nitrite transporter family protein [Limimaricola cinnabarinus]|uniref:Putative transport n=1 Tax=Limimaricola cinnabarinus LL-001 TaxID=1337093 RepID=U3AJ11_9RHOB|nr:formate/nitrite transporter family protein [Limimaricola cinnabarinus]GAD54778.1 putative transport [Limimaricola cinnabarinus LL-001]
MDNAPHRDPEHADHVRNKAEAKAVNEASHLSARLVYHVVLREGEEELKRPNAALFWAGIAAGLMISVSVMAEAVLKAHLPEVPWAVYIADFGYCFGFLLVILSRMQLFTENTISTVLPLLTHRDGTTLWKVARLWALVLGANIIGAFLAAAFFVHTSALPPEMSTAMGEISVTATSAGAWENFWRAIPAGILIAALVWMISSGDHEYFLIITAFTWLIAAGDFQHVIAGSVEMAHVVLSGAGDLPELLVRWFGPVLLGNVIGGTAIFTLTAWGQVQQEVQG